MESRFGILVSATLTALTVQPVKAADCVASCQVTTSATARIQNGLRVDAGVAQKLRLSRIEMQKSERLIEPEQADAASVPTARQTLVVIDLF